MRDHSPLTHTQSVAHPSPIHQDATPELGTAPDAAMMQGKQFAGAGALTPQAIKYLQRTHGNHFTQQYVQGHRPAIKRQPAATSPESMFPVLKNGARESRQRATAQPDRTPAPHEPERQPAPVQHPEHHPAAFRTVAQHVVGQWVNSLHKGGAASVYHPEHSPGSPSAGTQRGPVGAAVGGVVGGILGGIGGALVGGIPGAIGGALLGGAAGAAIGNAVGGPASVVPTSIARTVIDRNSDTLGPTTYGFVFKHTLNTNTGGTITPDVTIAEHVTVGRDDFNTGWGGVPLGSLTWGPGGTAPLSGNDMYDNITTPGVNVTDFMPSPPKPGLPAILETPQTLHYRIGTGSWNRFASVPMILTLRSKPAGGYEVETAINGVGRAQPYTGPTP